MMFTGVVKESRAVPRPASLIFTLFGDFVHREPVLEDALPVKVLVRLMGEFGLSEAAVRQAVSRMGRQGWLTSRRAGSRSSYALSEKGRGRVEAIAPRIYGPVIEWDGRWRILTYSVPERSRAARDRLRKDLAVLGWAPLTAATWISPVGSIEAARNAAEVDRAGAVIDIFHGRYCGPKSDRELLERCWDLPAIDAQYRRFLDRYAPRLQTEIRRNDLKEAEAFVERMWLVHDYRKFTYVDPGLPSALMAAGWAGTSAASVFRRYYALLSPQAEQFFRSFAVHHGRLWNRN